MDDGIPAGVAPDQADIARDTLGGAVAVSEELPASLTTGLLDAARDAFTLGLQAAALASAAVAAATAAVTILFLRRVRAGAVGEGPSELEHRQAPIPVAEVESGASQWQRSSSG